MIEGHASPRLISKANVCVESWTIKRNHTHAQQSSSEKKHPPQSREKDVWRERGSGKKGCESGFEERGLEPQ